MEVIEFFDNSGKRMVYRYQQPNVKTGETQAQIAFGSQLVVRESQAAIFFRDGKALDVFGPGRHVLKTQNLPGVTKITRLVGYGKTSPFRAEVYFINLKIFRGIPWGTKNPLVLRDNQLMLKDSELGIIRFGCHGIFSIRINDPQLFVNTIVGTQNIFEDQEIWPYLKEIVIFGTTDTLGKNLKSIFELPKLYTELSTIVKNHLSEDFARFGVELVDFYFSGYTIPEEVEKLIDTKTGMNVIQDMNKYLQFQAAKALEKAATQRDGVAGIGVGLGAGVGLGTAMAGAIKEGLQPKGKEDAYEQIKKLKELLDAGAITKEEFEEKKKGLLKKI
ncbi:SPFH domain-containing protein [bacterium]|nr:SPFH domain-containing protein [bacterium]